MSKKKRAAYLSTIVGVCAVLLIFIAFTNGAYATKKGTVTATSLNVRTGTGTNYSILKDNGGKVQVKKGTSVTILNEKNGWYQISFTFNKKTLKGYVDKNYIKLTTTSTTSSTSSNSSTATKFKIPATSRAVLNVRTAAGTKASQLKVNGAAVKLSKKQAFTILNEATVSNVNWYYISFTHNKKTQYGWISGDYAQLKLSSTVQAHVRVSSYTIRKSAGTSAAQLKYNNKAVKLSKNASIKIYQEHYKNNKRWFYVSFSYSGKTLKGYIDANSVYFKTTVSTSTATPTKTPTPTVKPTTTPTPVQKPNSSTSNTNQALTDAEFETMLKNEGFPEDYKVALRALHKQHPTWRFEAMKTGLSWPTVITAETKSKGTNTVQKSTPQWISRLTTAFDYVKDKPVVCDGSNWVTTSIESVSYYMDPRNHLTESGVFQFEHLGYSSKNHTKAAIQAMVKGTPFDANFTYTSDDGKKITMSYVDAFMDAAAYSGVSPIHLVARCKQEILVYKNGRYEFSNSATGTVKGYEGYYNFFNIGATDSASGAAITNGLKYAQNGSSNATTNQKMFIPWNNQYKSIMGGAKFIGDSYIAKGQNTIYLQKFNVSTYSTYYHQYMTNVQAPASEAKKQYQGYKDTNTLDIGLVFRIPVYNNMPTKAATYPDDLSTYYKNSFNHYLSGFTIANASNNSTLVSTTSTGTNKFAPTSTAQTFTINSVDKIRITPTVAHSKATITISAKNGTTTTNLTPGSNYTLKVGTTTITTTVKAVNGDTRKYTTTINRTK